jgi:hypothetical protein
MEPLSEAEIQDIERRSRIGEAVNWGIVLLSHRILSGQLAEARAQVAKLESRLEIDHAYDQHGNRVEVPVEKRDQMPDGISCRDETIKLLEKDLERVRGDAAVLRSWIDGIMRLTTREEVWRYVNEDESFEILRRDHPGRLLLDALRGCVEAMRAVTRRSPTMMSRDDYRLGQLDALSACAAVVRPALATAEEALK